MSAGTAVGGARELLGMRGTAWSSWPETAPSPLRFFLKKVPWCMVCGRAAADVTYQISTYYWISTYTLRISTYTLLPMLLPVLVPRARLAYQPGTVLGKVPVTLDVSLPLHA